MDMHNETSLNISQAMKIMDFQDVVITDLTEDMVKRQYKKMALKLHPDKNGNTDASTKHFQELGEAYALISKVISTEDFVDPFFSDNDFSVGGSYMDILKQFMRSTMEGSYSDKLCEKIKEIVTNYQNISVGLFENIDRDTSLSIYQFLCTYKHLLYIDTDILEKVKSVIQQKFDTLEIYTIEPSVCDLLNDYVYKLNVDGEQFLVPLWHKEMYFDSKSGKEIMVICNPILEKNCNIDDNNNLIVSCDIPFDKSLIEKELVYIECIPNYKIAVFTSMLHFKKLQTVRLRKKGILQINEQTIYNTSTERGDIILKIRFV
uniref:J domain-containing protein n=1 Tax=viral metagenome TaxID=1070528 RepID=A0A6C0FIK8_9ZZZZ|tara:strand:- start:6570 stop:7523 length:954 start_codon:yes stop_codon:yes gene_type:complete